MYTSAIQPRDDQPSGLSRQTIIIIAACSGGGGLLVLLMLFRIIRKRRAKPAVPLPPIQPLAHHREQQLAQFENSLRPQTWYDSRSVSTRAFTSKSPAGSKVSLLRESSLATTPSLPTSSSISHDLGPEVEVASYTPRRNASLRIPSTGTGSSSSVILAGTEESFSSSTPPSTPRPTPRNVSGPRSAPINARPRPLSMSSSHSHTSRASRHTVRGTPHGPLSNVQVILPEPLAPLDAGNGFHPLPRSRTNSGAYDRLSIADPWISVGNLNDIAQRPSRPLVSISETSYTPRRSHSLARNDERRSPIPPVPQLPTNWDSHDRAQAPFRSAPDSVAPQLSPASKEDGNGAASSDARKLKKKP